MPDGRRDAPARRREAPRRHDDGRDQHDRPRGHAQSRRAARRRSTTTASRRASARRSTTSSATASRARTCSRTATSSTSTSRRSTTASTATRRRRSTSARRAPRRATSSRSRRKSLELGIAEVKDGARLGDIGAAIQEYVEAQGCSVVRDFVGHGIGRRFHEDAAGEALRQARHGRAHQGGHDLHDRADGEPRPLRGRGRPERQVDRHAPPTARSPRSSSTRSSSRRPAARCSPSAAKPLKLSEIFATVLAV